MLCLNSSAFENLMPKLINIEIFRQKWNCSDFVTRCLCIKIWNELLWSCQGETSEILYVEGSQISVYNSRNVIFTLLYSQYCLETVLYSTLFAVRCTKFLWESGENFHVIENPVAFVAQNIFFFWTTKRTWNLKLKLRQDKMNCNPINKSLNPELDHMICLYGKYYIGIENPCEAFISWEQWTVKKDVFSSCSLFIPKDEMRSQFQYQVFPCVFIPWRIRTRLSWCRIHFELLGYLKREKFWPVCLFSIFVSWFPTIRVHNTTCIAEQMRLLFSILKLHLS